MMKEDLGCGSFFVLLLEETDKLELMLFFLCPYEQQGVKTDNQQRNGKRKMCPLLVKEKISEEKDNETCPCGISYDFIYFGIHRSGVEMLYGD